MIPYLEINSRCVGCDNCLLICPSNAIIVEDGNYAIEKWSCTLCQFCVEACPVDCIKLIED